MNTFGLSKHQKKILKHLRNDFRKCNKEEKEISLEEVNDYLNTVFLCDKVEEINSGNCTDEPLKDLGCVEVLAPCVYNECPRSESGEDCCHSNVNIDGKDYCKVLIDINSICGLPPSNAKYSEIKKQLEEDKLVEETKKIPS